MRVPMKRQVEDQVNDGNEMEKDGNRRMNVASYNAIDDSLV